MHDSFYASPNYYDDSSLDDEMPDGPCHWHGKCRDPCMNRFPMENFTKAAYVFREGNVYATPDFTSKWGLTTLDAVPAYEIIVGQYVFGPSKGHAHVMYTLDQSGSIRVPRSTGMGEASWEYWHAKYDSSTRLGDLVRSDERAGMSHSFVPRAGI